MTDFFYSPRVFWSKNSSCGREWKNVFCESPSVSVPRTPQESEKKLNTSTGRRFLGGAGAADFSFPDRRMIFSSKKPGVNKKNPSLKIGVFVQAFFWDFLFFFAYDDNRVAIFLIFYC
jgi:hypothetical protein